MVMGRVWRNPDPDPFIFIDPDPNLNPKGPKFSDPDPDPNPPDLTGLRSLMGLIQSLFDLSKLNLFRVFANS